MMDQKERHRRHLAQLKARMESDPDFKERFLKRRRANETARRRANPEKAKAKGKQGRERYRERMAADPELAEEQRKKARERAKDRRQNDLEFKERTNRLTRENRKENPEKFSKWHSDYKTSHPMAARDAVRKWKYGITTEEWEAMFDAQGRVCKICGINHPRSPRGWHTDHVLDENGKVVVRGILCAHCNTSLKSYLTPALLRKMANYVEARGLVESAS